MAFSKEENRTGSLNKVTNLRHHNYKNTAVYLSIITLITSVKINQNQTTVTKTKVARLQ